MTSPPPLTDAALVQRFRETGDADAFGAIASRYDARMRGLALSILRNEADARDAVQDALARAYQNIDGLADPDRIGGWLLKIVFGCSIDRIRSRKRSVPRASDPDRGGPPCPEPPPDAHLNAQEWSRRVVDAIGQLPDHHRRPLLLFHLDGLSTREVANHLGVPQGTARSLLTRSRARLQRLLPSDLQEIPPMAHTVFREHAASAGLLDGADHLHLMNGDAAAERLRRAGVAGPVVVWSDVLHEGPASLCDTPGAWRAARAEHLASMDFGEVDTLRQRLVEADAAVGDPTDGRERVLWFEHDLYDQLLLIRHLHWLESFGSAAPCRASLICIGAFPGIRRFIGLGQLEPDQIVSLLDTRQPIAPQHLSLGAAVWRSYCDPDPQSLRQWLDEDTSCLPYLRPAILRHLQQYPSVFNGLSRTEHTVLGLLQAQDAGVASAGELFAGDQASEEAPFSGDAVFYAHLQRLADEPRPAISLDGTGSKVTPQTRVALTDTGRDLLQGRTDRVNINGVDRWLGGVKLTGNGPLWRWDAQRDELVQQ